MALLSTVLTSVAVICALTTCLALLIVLAEALIADYGEQAVTINDREPLTVEGGRPLLAALKDRDIFVPSACGGRGSCGLCKLRVLAGGGDLLPTELPWLSEAERQTGMRLSCQLKVKRPLHVEIPEEILGVREYRVEVTAMRDLTCNIKGVTLRLLDPARIEFRAGQFVQLEVPPYELTDEPVYRAYSMASPPSRPDVLELHIKYVPDGICTSYVHKHLRVGDRLSVNGPYGQFGLRDSGREAVFVAGGSGMAPMRAILLDMAERGDPRRVRYFFGANVVADLYLVEEMRDLEKRLPAFAFIPTVRAPAEGEDWDGERGLVTEALSRQIESASEMEAYLCGPPPMIDASVKVLVARGLPPERVYFDKFT